MDFFSAGGFQQLFSDLHEQQVDALQFRNVELSFDGLDDVFSKNSCDTYAGSDESEELFGVSTAPTFCNYDYDGMLLPAALDPAVTGAVVITDNEYLVELNATVTATANVCFEHNNVADGRGDGGENLLNISDQHLQHSLDFLLPAEAESNTTEDHVRDLGFMTREMAEWEEKFLDNYIEISELIDFLPEKTPLCTETCELHLLESSQQLQLQLHTKTKRPKADCAGVADDSSSPSLSFDPDRGYACTFGQCRKIYAKPAHLKAHLRRHLGEKPYVCTWPECAWKFSRSDELARHRRSHSGVKPYKCDYCMKCFARSDHLMKHRKVHERRMLAASEAGRAVDGVMPQSVFTVRPGRKRKNQDC